MRPREFLHYRGYLAAVDAAMDSQPPRDFAQRGPLFLQYPLGFAVGCRKLLMRRRPQLGVIENLVAPAVVADVQQGVRPAVSIGPHHRRGQPGCLGEVRVRGAAGSVAAGTEYRSLRPRPANRACSVRRHPDAAPVVAGRIGWLTQEKGNDRQPG